MIIVLLPYEPTAEDMAAESFEAFAGIIHGRVPHDYSIDLHTDAQRERAFCGEDWRVVPTRQGLCPRCGGSVMTDRDLAAWRSRQEWGARHGLFDAVAVERRRKATLARKSERTNSAA